jgi:DHA1 family inner membrane transport protein
MRVMPVLPLMSLAIATFGVATTELVVMGLLPTIAADLGVSIPMAGLLVTAYAASVVVWAPIAAVVTNGVARKNTLLGLMAAFTLGNAICALAPTYEILLAARVLTAMAHAATFGIASVVAASIVPQDRRATAISIVFAGAALATILGVPLGTAVGRAFGWQTTFWMVTLIGCLAMAAIVAWLPADVRSERANLRGELGMLRDRQVQIGLVVTALSWCGVFAVFTYVTPILEEVTQLSEEAVIVVLFLFGVGMTVGNFVGGRLGDWHLLPSIVGIIAAIAACLVIVAIVIHNVHFAVLALIVWGLFIFALAPVLQTWVVGAARTAPNLASTVNQASFHMGTAGGAWIGASALSYGITYDHLPWLGVVMTLAALAFAVGAVSMEYRHRKAVFATDIPAYGRGSGG